MKQQLVNLIACVNKENALGRNGELLYRMNHDFEWFKMLTKGHIVVMGVKTYLEIGKPLPGRVNIVVFDESRPKPNVHPNVILATGLEDAMLVAGRYMDKEVFIIGGQHLYHKAFKYGVDYIFRTCVQEDESGDVHFIPLEAIKEQFELKNVFPKTFEGLNRVNNKSVLYQFEVWEKRKANQAVKAIEWLNEQEGSDDDGF